MERHVTLEQLDFRLLKAFLALFEERHVGRAANVLGISQPAMSTLLAQLRKVCGDALFVRGQRQMHPTPLAERWATPIRAALTALELALNERDVFVAADSRRDFTLYMSDAGHATLFADIARRALAAAPHIRLNAVNRWDGSLADRLDEGTIDLAVGWLPQLDGRKSSMALFRDRYIGMCSAAALPGSRCAVAAMIGTPHEAVIQRFIKHGIAPTVVVPTFLMLPELLHHTDLMAILPSTLAQAFLANQRAKLQLVEPPFPLPTLDIRLYWALGADRNAGLTWLRNIVATSAAALGARARMRTANSGR